MDKKLLVQLLLLKKGIQKENNIKFDNLNKELLSKLNSIQLQKGDKGDAYSITDKDDAEIASLVTLPDVKDGNDYVLTQEDKETIASLVELPIVADGKDYILTDEDKDHIASLVPISEIPEFAEKTIEEIRDSLEDLTDEERLDVLKLKNLDKLELDASQIKNLQNNSSKGLSGMTRYAVEQLVKKSGGGIEQYANLTAFPATGKTDILYIAIDTNLSYRWTGSVYQKVGDGADTVWGDITGTLADQTDLQDALENKQDTLESATNIKTINGNSILGSGDIEVGGAVLPFLNLDLSFTGFGSRFYGNFAGQKSGPITSFSLTSHTNIVSSNPGTGTASGLFFSLEKNVTRLKGRIIAGFNERWRFFIVIRTFPLGVETTETLYTSQDFVLTANESNFFDFDNLNLTMPENSIIFLVTNRVTSPQSGVTTCNLAMEFFQ